MNREFIEHNDFVLGSMILLVTCSFELLSDMIKQDEGKSVIDDSFVQFACQKGRLFIEFVKKIDNERPYIIQRSI